MPSDQEITPEEKLLKVIQSGGPAPGKGKAAKPVSTGSDTDDTVTAETRVGPKPVAKIKPRIAGKPAGVLKASKKKDEPAAEPAPKPEETKKKGAVAKKEAARKAKPEKAAGGADSALGGAPRPVERAGTGPLQRRKIERSPTLTICFINRIIAACFVALLFGFAWEIKATRPVAPRDVGDTPPIIVTSEESIVGLGEETEYTEPAKLRNLWLPPDANGQTNEVKIVPPTGGNLSARLTQYAASNLRLVGVSIYEDEPERSFVVVHDKATGEIHNLKLNGKTNMELPIDKPGTPFGVTVKKVSKENLFIDFEGTEIPVAGKE